MLIKVFKFVIIDQPVEDEQAPMPRQECYIMPSQSSVSLTLKSISDFENELTPPTTSKINLMTPKLASALDRTNVSSKNATFILAATLKSVGFVLNNVNISYKTIQRSRIALRKEIAEGLKDALRFKGHYIVHWDGKLLTDITGTESVDTDFQSF